MLPISSLALVEGLVGVSGVFGVLLGGQVKGGEIFGDVPEPDPKGNQYTENRARMIPTTSVEQYASGLGRWFGLQDASLFSQFPNLRTFDTELPDCFNT